MYTLHVVASERRLSQVSLPNAAGGEPGLRPSASRQQGLLGDADSFSDDSSEGELLGIDLDDDSQAIEFTAGNPRVEHITGVVHLYRPTPGLLPQTNTSTTPAAAALTTPATQQQHHRPGAPAVSSALPALINAPPPAKGPASWASLLGAPPPPAQPAPAAAAGAPQPPPPSPAAAVGEGCDELCCLALPSDMTIADFCTFLGAHLLRLRRMRVLRREVAPATHAVATASTPAPASVPAPAQGSSGASTSRPPSGGGGDGGSGGDQPAVEPSEDSQGGRQRDGRAAGRKEDLGPHPRQGDSGGGGGGPPPLTHGSSSSDCSATPNLGSQSSSAPSRTSHPHQPQPHQQQQLAPLPAPRPPHHPAGRPPSQRVVCMVVMRMESPEAADELYNDLNGKAFSSLEPDIVCRLVHVRHVEVTSGGGRHAAAAEAGRGAAAVTDALAADAAPVAAAPAAAAVSLHAPPPGQTELPTCPVCLERLDEHVSGIVTTVCNHMFHSECLQKWADTTCPVCRYCVQGAANTSRCGVCSTAVDLWICLICGHVGCGRYRAGHAADHWRTSGHCYALELETQRVWDYVGDNYVHRLIQSKTDGKLVELAAPANAVASPHAGGRGGGGGHRHYHHHHHHSHDSDSCGAAAAGGFGFGFGGGGPGGDDGGRGGYGGGGASSSSGGHDGGGGPGWSTADEQLKEALMASKLDAIAVEYNHLLASQLDSQRQYYEGLVAQATLDADHRCARAGAAADKARAEAEEAQAAAREEARRRHAAERRAAEASEALRTVRQEAEFLRSLNETLLANQRDFKQQLAAEKARADAAGAAVKELQEQVRDLAFFIEAQRTINDAGDGELKEGTVLPLPQNNPARGGRGGGSASGSRTGTRAGGGRAGGGK